MKQQERSQRDQDRESKLPEVEHFSQAEDRPCSVEVRQHHDRIILELSWEQWVGEQAELSGTR